MTNEDGLRVCTRCKEAKPVQTEFSWCYSKQYGRRVPHSYCKLCAAAAARENYAKKPKERRPRIGRPRKTPRTEAKALGLPTYFTGIPCKNGHISPRKTRDGGCIECIRERDRTAQRGKYYGKNRDKVIARVREWNENNPGAAVRRNKQWRIDNPEKYAESQRNHKGKRRAAILAYVPQDGSLIPTRMDLRLIREAQGDACVYCGAPLNGRGHLDHMQPLSRGGGHILTNLQWLCAPCNQKKGAKTDEEFRDWLCRSMIPIAEPKPERQGYASLRMGRKSQGQLILL